MADEIQQLIIKVQGEKDLEAAVKALKAEREAFDAADETRKRMVKSGAMTMTQYEAAMRQSASSLLAATKNVSTLEKTVAAAAKGGRLLSGNAVQNVGYAIQDFTSASGGVAQKLNAVTNNLQQVAVSIGVGGPIFLGITVGMAALQLFLNNFEAISDYFAGIDRKALEAKAKAAEKAAEKARREQEALAKSLRGELEGIDRQAAVEKAGDVGVEAAGAARDVIAARGGTGAVVDALTRDALARLPNPDDFRPEAFAGAKGRAAEEIRRELTTKRDAAIAARNAVTRPVKEMVIAATTPEGGGARRELARRGGTDFLLATDEGIRRDRAAVEADLAATAATPGTRRTVRARRERAEREKAAGDYRVRIEEANRKRAEEESENEISEREKAGEETRRENAAEAERAFAADARSQTNREKNQKDVDKLVRGGSSVLNRAFDRGFLPGGTSPAEIATARRRAEEALERQTTDPDADPTLVPLINELVNRLTFLDRQVTEMRTDRELRKRQIQAVRSQLSRGMGGSGVPIRQPFVWGY